MRITVDGGSRNEVARVQRGFRQLPKDFKNTLKKYQRAEFNPIWKDEVASSASRVGGPYPMLFKAGNTVQAGVPTILKAANSSRKSPSNKLYTLGELAVFYEFGATNQNITTRYYRKNRSGNGRHMVTRRTTKGLPARRRNGYVTSRALSGFVKRAAQLHAQTLTKSIYEVLKES